MITGGAIIKIHFQIGLVHIERKFIGVNRILVTGDIVLITVVSGNENRVQFVAENMLPFQGNVLIAVIVKRIAVKVKPVIAQVTRYVQTVLFIKLMADIQVHIIKRCPAVFILRRQSIERPIRQQVVLPPMINEDLSFISGTSSSRRLVNRPIPADPAKSFLFPSLLVMSRIDDNRPPYLAGILLLYN